LISGGDGRHLSEDAQIMYVLVLSEIEAWLDQGGAVPMEYKAQLAFSKAASSGLTEDTRHDHRAAEVRAVLKA